MLTDAVCCNGRLSSDYVESLGYPGNRITRGHMAADTENLARQVNSVSANTREHIRRDLKIAGTLILYVGQLIRRKGLAPLLRAWRAFESEHLHAATLVLVGQGVEEQSLRNQVGTYMIQNVRFTGGVDYDDLAHYYAAADAFIIPTLEDNWSLVVPEAMACGLPILCSKYNGCWPELVQEGKNGWVFDPHDGADVLRCLNECTKKPQALAEMGSKAREIIKSHGPQQGALSVLEACEIALRRRKRKLGARDSITRSAT
jgi:glycosyltransferase involved in cell wall biosynthesis